MSEVLAQLEKKGSSGGTTKLANVVATRVGTANTQLTIDITSLYAGYNDLTIDNIVIESVALSVSSSSSTRYPSFTYTYLNGVITITSTIAFMFGGMFNVYIFI